MNKVEQFINNTRNIANCMEDLCLHGGCWQFHELLKTVWPDAEPYWNDKHVITKIGNYHYDITGKVSSGGYKLMSPRARYLAAEWEPQYKITVYSHD